MGLVVGIAVAASASVLVAERNAAACGGCFHPPTQTATDITDERMLLAVSPTQSTLYDQIQYSGTPSSFAWVLPIHGTVTVGLSADVLFDSIDALTATQIVAPSVNCPIPPNCNLRFGGASGGVADSAAAEAPGAVTVLKQENVGPYATVQLHATDSSALNGWLTQNGFSIPADVVPIIDEYVAEGSDFLAMNLLPNQGVQAMRPVRVTTPGAGLSLPLRMAAIGTGATVGITIWVVSDGRYEPQNYPFFHIDDSALVWDWSTNSSNYTTLRAQNETASGNKTWEIESSLELNQQIITNVILSGGQVYSGPFFGGGVAFEGGPGGPSDPALDYLPVGSPDAGADAGPFQTAEDVRTADIDALFAGLAGPNVRVTRMRSDIAHAAMTADFTLGASTDQAELSNVRNVTQSINLQCPIYDNQCTVTGYGTAAQAAASGPGGDASTGTGTFAADASPGTSVLDATTTTTPGATVADAAISSDAGVEHADASTATPTGSASSGQTGAGGGDGSAVSTAAASSGSREPGNAVASGGGGCSASARSAGGPVGGFGFATGMMGLLATGFARRRRSSPQGIRAQRSRHSRTGGTLRP
jgi:hypothetical protein